MFALYLAGDVFTSVVTKHKMLGEVHTRIKTQLLLLDFFTGLLRLLSFGQWHAVSGVLGRYWL